MRGGRDRAADLLERAGLALPVRRARGWLQQDVPVLAYHRVLDIEPEEKFPFDPELVSATPAAFREQVRYLARHFTPITFGELARALRGEVALPSDAVVITFDDGYRDNYEHAFAILREEGVVATFFVSTGYLGLRRPFWFDRVAYALYRAPEGLLAVPDSDLRLPLGDPSSRRRAAWALVEHLKTLPDPERRRRLDRLAERIEMQVDAADLDLACPMSWEQVVEMHEAGMEFGSHTVSHPVLTRLDGRALARELADSRRHLEAALATPVQILSYPFGSTKDYDPRVIEAVAGLGYTAAATYLPGRNDPRSCNAYEVRRLHVERYTGWGRFVASLAVPELFAGGGGAR